MDGEAPSEGKGSGAVDARLENLLAQIDASMVKAERRAARHRGSTPPPPPPDFTPIDDPAEAQAAAATPDNPRPAGEADSDPSAQPGPNVTPEPDADPEAPQTAPASAPAPAPAPAEPTTAVATETPADDFEDDWAEGDWDTGPIDPDEDDRLDADLAAAMGGANPAAPADSDSDAPEPPADEPDPFAGVAEASAERTLEEAEALRAELARTIAEIDAESRAELGDDMPVPRPRSETPPAAEPELAESVEPEPTDAPVVENPTEPVSEAEPDPEPEPEPEDIAAMFDNAVGDAADEPDTALEDELAAVGDIAPPAPPAPPEPPEPTEPPTQPAAESSPETEPNTSDDDELAAALDDLEDIDGLDEQLASMASSGEADAILDAQAETNLEHEAADPADPVDIEPDLSAETPTETPVAKPTEPAPEADANANDDDDLDDEVTLPPPAGIRPAVDTTSPAASNDAAETDAAKPGPVVETPATKPEPAAEPVALRWGWLPPKPEWPAATGRARHAVTAWRHLLWIIPPLAVFIFKHVRTHALALYTRLRPRTVVVLTKAHAPLEKLDPKIKSAVGWIGAYTCFLAGCLWAFVLFVQKPTIPEATAAPTTLHAQDPLPGSASPGDPPASYASAPTE